MVLRKWILFAGVISILLLNCSQQSSHTFTTNYNENNIPVWTNSGGPKYTEPLYTVQENLSLGGEEPEPKLFRPYGVLVDDEENIYCVDEGRIRKFSPDGRFIKYISRPGQGPGEVSHPTLDRIIGDTLIVGQNMWSGWRKFELLNSNGDFIARIPFPRLQIDPKPGLRKSTVAPLRNSLFLFDLQNPVTDEQNSPLHYSYGIADGAGQVIKMLELDLKPFKSWVNRDNRGTVLPFVVGAESTVGESIYILSGEGDRIDQFSHSGELERIIHLNLPRAVLTDDDINKVLENRAYGGQKSILIKSDFPEYMPLSSALIVDDQNRFWLQKGADDHSYRLDNYTYMILSAEGEYLADQVFPCKIEVVKRGMAYGYVVNEDDVRILKRFQLVSH